MLLCADDTIYSGYTVDLDKRINCHNSGKASKYTRTRRPVHLVYYEQFDTKSDAMKREASYKRLDRSEKLALIAEFDKSGEI